MGIPAIARRHQAALDRPRTGTCATCAVPERRPGPLKPGKYELYFFEFKDFESARDVRRLGRPLVQERYKVPASTSTVYVFQRQGGRTTLAKALHGFGPYTVTVHPDDGPVEIYACLSHFPLPAQRVAQYTSADGFAALQRRCVRFDPAPSTSVRPNSATSFDVVMPDWRRLSWELHSREQQALDALGTYTEQHAERRILAELTLTTAVAYEKKDRRVWEWLESAPYASHPAHGRPRHRLHGLEGKKYTACENELYQMQRHVEYLHNQIEEHAAAKYEWMAERGYREMRWDSLTLPGAQNDTVRAEATLLNTASQSLSGQAYLKSYAVSNGWYLRYLRNMRPEEKQAVRTDPSVADAYWTLLAAVGAVLLADAYPEADRTQQGVDVVKYGTGAGDAVTKWRLKKPEQKADRAAKDYEHAAEAAKEAKEHADEVDKSGREGSEKANREAKTARTLADELTAAERSPTWVVEHVLLASMRDGPGHAPEYVRPSYATYHPRHPPPVTRPGDYAGPAAIRTTRGEAEPALAARARDARRGATTAEVNAELRAGEAARETKAAQEHAHQAAEARATAEGQYLRATKFEADFAGHAWMTTRAVVALNILNLGLAVKAWRHASNPETQWKLGGAVFDLIYSTEFILARGAVQAERAAATAGAAEAPLAGQLVKGARVFGVLGGAISMYYSFRDAGKASARGDTELMVGSYLGAAGTAVLTAAALGSLMAGSAIAETTGGALLVGVLGAGLFTLFGAVLVFGGAVLIWYFTNPPVKDWLMHCPWGTRPEEKSDGEQLRALLQLLCTPQLSARQVRSGRGRGFPTRVLVTIRPPLFFASESTMHCELTVYENDQNPESGLPVQWPVAGTSHRFEIGPVGEEVMERLAYGPVPCSVRGLGAQGLHVTLRREGSVLAFECEIELERVLDSRRHGGLFDSDARWFSVGGTAHLKLWSGRSGSVWSRITLDEVHLPDTEIAGTD